MNDGKIPSEPLFSIELGDLPIKQVDLTMLQSSIFPVVVRSEDRFRSIGTCFAISNHGLCLTARHVIEDIGLSGEQNDAGVPTFVDEVGVLYVNPDYNHDSLTNNEIFGGFIPIRTVHLIGGTDIGLMHLDLPVHATTGEYIKILVNPLTLSAPSISDKIIGFGYDQGDWSQNSDGSHYFKHNFKATQGDVTQIFPLKRDSAMAPFPCFETTATFLPGMSGGPVLSQAGLVVGVIATGFEFADEGPPVSYVSLIAPAMFISLLAKTGGGEEMRFLWDFCTGGSIMVDRGEAKIVRTGAHLSISLGDVLYNSKLGS